MRHLAAGGAAHSEVASALGASINSVIAAAAAHGVTITRHLEHCAAPLRRDVLLELEREFPDDFSRTAASRFRSATDISVTNSLYHYYALLTGRATVQQKAKVRYVDTTMRAGLVAMEKLLVKRNVDMFCLNDGSFPEISTDERAEAVRSFLDNYFPVVAPWERVEAIESESRAG